MHTILCFKHSTGPSYSSLLKSKSFAPSDLLNYTLNVLNRNGPSRLDRIMQVKTVAGSAFSILFYFMKPC